MQGVTFLKGIMGDPIQLLKIQCGATDNKVPLGKIDMPCSFKWYTFLKEREKQTIKLNETWLITTLKPPGS